MATLTIISQGVEEQKRLLDRIIQDVSRKGLYSIEIKNNVGFADLAANELVQFGVLKRGYRKGLSKQDSNFFEYSEGENFAEAKLKGPHNYLEEKKRELNPSKSNKFWKALSTNPLIVSVISALIGALIVLIFT
jgi:hypothetical protein